MGKGVCLEELFWTCKCGAPMALETPKRGAWLDLDCRHCGLVGSVSIRLKDQIRPPAVVFQSTTSAYPEGDK